MGRNADHHRDQELKASIESHSPFVGKILKIRQDTIAVPQSAPYIRECALMPRAVAIIPIDPKGHIILVEQWRRAVGKITLEIPAGMMDHEGEEPLHCAQRELQEETGFFARTLKPFGGCYPSPGVTTEYIHLFLGTSLEPRPLQAEDTHLIDIRSIPLADALHMIETGEILDAKTQIGIMRYARL
jgi:ADP-ribose pyrophosphatase